METTAALRLFVLAILALIPLTPMPGQDTATPAPPPHGSAVFDWNQLAVRTTNVGARRDVIDKPTATLERFESHVTTLNPGLASHPPHRHAQEEFIILREGTLDVIINGRTQRAGAGSVLFFAANDFHNVANVGDAPATYLVFNFATAATRTAPAEGAATAALPGKLGSAVFDWLKLEAVPTRTGERRAVFDSPTVTMENLEMHVTTLNPGVAPHAAHRHPDEELVIVKDGLIEVTINGVSQRAGPGSIFFFASNDEHGMKNAGDTRATYYVVRLVTGATPRTAAP